MEDRDVNLPQIKNFVNYTVIYDNLCKFTIFVVCLGEILIYLIFGAFRLTYTVFFSGAKYFNFIFISLLVVLNHSRCCTWL